MLVILLRLVVGLTVSPFCLPRKFLMRYSDQRLHFLTRSIRHMDRSLEMLVGVNLAEEGILRLLFAAVYLMFSKVGSENDISAASR